MSLLQKIEEKTEEVWNNDTWEYETVTVKDTSIDLRFIFADSSKTDLKAYFKEGFDGLFDELNKLIAELNETYGWKIKEINKENPQLPFKEEENNEVDY